MRPEWRHKKTQEQPRAMESDIPNGEIGIAVLDAGAQYGQVIDRRIRGLKVKTTFFPLNTPADKLRGCTGIVLSGGPKSVNDKDAPEFDPEVLNLQVPILGICYGLHLIAKHEGGKVRKKRKRQDGPCKVRVDPSSKLFNEFSASQNVLMSHGDSVVKLPKGFRQTAESDGLIAAMENPDKQMYAVQFHPEVDITEHGKEILGNFVFDVVGSEANFTMEDRREKAISEIKERVGDRKVMVFVSGGVDSTVCAALLKEALGSNKVTAVHVDNGFMRKNESTEVKRALNAIGLELEVVDASERFFDALKGVIEPEKKRKIIGDQFIKIALDKIVEMYGDDLNSFIDKHKDQMNAENLLKIVLEYIEQTDGVEKIFLAQGTLRPDLIESASKLASGNADTIKTHHNDSPLARAMRDADLLVEPLTDYHKDEVRELGEQLGLPKNLVWRQPFPGPGLAIRVIGAYEAFLDGSRRVQRKLKKFNKDGVKATVLPIKTVGVQGDARTYSHLVGLTGPHNWEELRELALQIPKNIHSVNRVAYIFGEPLTKPITQITNTEIDPESVEQLRTADAIVTEVMEKFDLLRKLSQVPVILTPIDFDGTGKRSIAIRTFMTNDYMTGLPAIPGKDIPEEALFEMVDRIMTEVPGISRVMYDLTSKPPGTTEWE